MTDFKTYKRKKVLGVNIDDVSIEKAVAKVEEWLTGQDNKSRIIVTPGPEFLVTANSDPEFKGILNAADLSVPDGFGLQLFGGITHRVPGVELMLALCKVAQQKKWTIGMIGNPNTGLAAKKLQEMFPGLKITFAYDNPQADRVIRDYDILRYVDILFVGLGHPKQEKFLYRFRVKPGMTKGVIPANAGIYFKVGMGVGGSFDFISGQVWEPGEIWSTLGLKWLGRLFSNPRHIFRIWRATVVFPFLVGRDKYVNLKRHG